MTVGVNTANLRASVQKKKNEPYNDCEKKRFCFLPAFEAQTLANRDIIVKSFNSGLIRKL